MRASLSQPSHEGAVCNQNHTITANQDPWPERRLASCITVSNFANYENNAFFAVFFPFSFEYPSTSEVFEALETFVVLYFLKSNKASCVQQVNDDIWVVVGNKTSLLSIVGIVVM